MNYSEISLKMHKKLSGKIEISSKVLLDNIDDLAIYYTPGVAQPCKEIAKDKNKSFDLTWRKNTVAVITDGTAVLGLGDIGPEAAMPVMEGKAAIFKKFANVNAVPICVATKEVDEIIKLVKWLQPSFGAINLEDISAPRCFQIERDLSHQLDIPVFHDDQHGTAIAVLAALKNALKIVDKKIEEITIVFSGAGAAGIATADLIVKAGARNLILCDSKGAIYTERNHLNTEKIKIARYNLQNKKGSLKKVLKGADVFIGLSVPNILLAEDIKTMKKNPIIFAMANPMPEILPDEAKKGGAMIVATGRSDFPNQINNALVFPGIFRGILDCAAKRFNSKMFIAAAEALASTVKNPTADKFIPSIFDKDIVKRVAKAVVNS